MKLMKYSKHFLKVKRGRQKSNKGEEWASVIMKTKVAGFEVPTAMISTLLLSGM
jgi:hypothetical protein